MRFTVSSSLLSNRLNALSKVINPKNSMPILESFLFQINDGQMTVMASDGENTMSYQIMLDESDSNGNFCISSRVMLEALKELAEQPITIDVNMDTMQTKIVYMNGMYDIMAMRAEEYPLPLEMSEDNTTIVMQSKALAEVISRSLFATATDELRPVMNGLYFDLKPEALTIVASDGHKLVRNMNFSITREEPASFILPKKPANQLKNVLAKDESEVVIAFDSKNAKITFADGYLICRLIEGRYPNYNSVIPQGNANHMVIDRKVLLGALKRVLPFASEASQLVRLRIESGRIEISSQDMDFAKGAREESICEYNGMPMSIGFKGTTLADVLNNLESEEIVLQLSDPARAGLIVPAQQPEGEDILVLMMPMLLND